VKEATRTPEERRRILLYGGVVAAYAAVWYGWPFLKPDEERPLQLYIPPIYTATVVLHELGHLAAAAMVGMRFQEIMVFGIKLSRTEEGWSWHIGDFNFGGHAGAIPIGIDRLPHRLAMFALGGPVAEGLSIVVALSLFSVWPGSPVLILWVILAGIGLYWSFLKDQENDLWHLQRVRGNDEKSKEHLASYALAAEGVDEEERQRYLTELGFPYALRDQRAKRLIAEMRLDELRDHMDEVLASDNFAKIEHRVWYECAAAYYFAFRNFDIPRAIGYLPPESRAQAYGMESVWLYASTLIAALQNRWDEAALYARRGCEYHEEDSEARRWFEMAKRSAERHLERASGT
jgi:hypothetical protein